MTGEKDCPFCPMFVAVEQDFLMITPLNPFVEGHKLFIPKRHVTDFAEIPEVSMILMGEVARYVKGRVGDCNIIMSRGERATQTVGHLHIHLIPRVMGDGLKLPWS